MNERVDLWVKDRLIFLKPKFTGLTNYFSFYQFFCYINNNDVSKMEDMVVTVNSGNLFTEISEHMVFYRDMRTPFRLHKEIWSS